MNSLHVNERQYSDSAAHAYSIGTSSTASNGVINTTEGADGAPLSSSQSLAEAILDAFPSGSYAMTGLMLLRLPDPSAAVPTAAVETAVRACCCCKESVFKKSRY